MITTSRRAAVAALTTGVAGCLGGPDCPTPTETRRVHTQSPPAIGESSSPVTVATWEDFSCPHCGTFTLEVVPKLREAYVTDGRARFVRHDFPIPVEEWAWSAASAARHVLALGGPAACFRFAAEIYDRQTYNETVAAKAAETAGVEVCPTVHAGSLGRYRPVVERDRQRGRDRGVNRTPTVFVDGERVAFDDGIAFDPVRSAVERAL